jgi:CheY-like chemotaxis protein
VFHFTANFEVQAEVSERRPNLALMLSGVRVLVVDDNFSNRLILREMLSSRGAEVDEARDGPAALVNIERAQSNGIPYKLMLLDCRMPGMDGFEVAERVKAGTAQGLTVMMLSSDDLKVQLTHAHELGLDAYLVKPVRRNDLFDAIGTAMAAHAARTDVAPVESGPGTMLAPPPVAPAKAPPMHPLRILLADDSTDNRLLIHAFFKDLPYQIDDADNGAVAVAMLKAGIYDLVLMDIQMPVMDGLEAIRTIRAREQKHGLAHTPIIALTASALDEDVRHTLEAGADLHVSKPIRKATLVAAVEKSVCSSPALAIARNSSDAAA